MHHALHGNSNFGRLKRDGDRGFISSANRCIK